MNEWSRVANINLLETYYLSNADIVLGMTLWDGVGGDIGLEMGNPSHSPYTMILFDQYDFGDIYYRNYKSFLDVAVHEIGHAIGINHTDGKRGFQVPGTAVMDRYYSYPFGNPILKPLDIAAAQYLYGASPVYTSLWAESEDLLFAT